MQVNQQTTDTRPVLDQALMEAVEEALMMAEFFQQTAQQPAQKQMHEVIGVDAFEIPVEAKKARPM